MLPGHRLGTPLLLIGITVAAALLLRAFVIGAAVVPTRSMEPTLRTGDFILINKMIVGSRYVSKIPLIGSFLSGLGSPFPKISRDDVLFFKMPDDYPNAGSSRYYIKRCVGVAGDTILIEGNSIRRAGRTTRAAGSPVGTADIKIVPRSGEILRLDSSTASAWKMLIEQEGHTVTVSGGSVFIDGRLNMEYKIEKNYLFMLGDNIHSSYDSRNWGFLPEDNVVGKALLVYWSLENESTAPLNFFSRIRWDRIGTLIK